MLTRRQLREMRHRLRSIHEATVDARCCMNYALAAGLGICEPRKVDIFSEIKLLLRNRGYRITTMLPDNEYSQLDIKHGRYQKVELYSPKLRTLLTFARANPKGTFLIDTSTGHVVLKDGKLYDYANRGINRRRLQSIIRLER